jgi:hypothetical protein
MSGIARAKIQYWTSVDVTVHDRHGKYSTNS